MNKINLSPEQKKLCIEFRDSFDERPTVKQYETYQKQMKVLDKKLVKPQLAKIANTTKGYESNEVVLGPKFDATKDLPVGWAVYSMHDSGGNHKIDSAGQLVLTNLWNFWYNEKTNTAKLLA